MYYEAWNVITSEVRRVTRVNLQKFQAVEKLTEVHEEYDRLVQTHG